MKLRRNIVCMLLDQLETKYQRMRVHRHSNKRANRRKTNVSTHACNAVVQNLV